MTFENFLVYCQWNCFQFWPHHTHSLLVRSLRRDSRILAKDHGGQISGPSIQNSMTNKNGRTIIKIRGILLCSYSYAKSVLMYLHMCANTNTNPANLFIFHVMLLDVVFVFVFMCENPHQNNIRML